MLVERWIAAALTRLAMTGRAGWTAFKAGVGKTIRAYSAGTTSGRGPPFSQRKSLGSGALRSIHSA